MSAPSLKKDPFLPFIGAQQVTLRQAEQYCQQVGGVVPTWRQLWDNLDFFPGYYLHLRLWTADKGAVHPTGGVSTSRCNYGLFDEAARQQARVDAQPTDLKPTADRRADVVCLLPTGDYWWLGKEAIANLN